jgi:hypothetical protein
MNAAKASAKEYEKLNLGKKAHIFRTEEFESFAKALQTPNIDRLEYWGHGDRGGLLLGDPRKGIYKNNLDELSRSNIRPGASVSLVSCNSAAGGANSIAQDFSNYFNSPTMGFTTGVSFGWSAFGRNIAFPTTPRGVPSLRTPGQR